MQFCGVQIFKFEFNHRYFRMQICLYTYLAPVAVEYDGGGVYLGGGSSLRPVVDRSLLDSEFALPNLNRVLGRYNCCNLCIINKN